MTECRCRNREAALGLAVVVAATVALQSIGPLLVEGSSRPLHFAGARSVTIPPDVFGHAAMGQATDLGIFGGG